jgi:hypothetical protein
MHKFILPKGDHRTRINSFNSLEQAEIYGIIDRWLAEE